MVKDIGRRNEQVDHLPLVRRHGIKISITLRLLLLATIKFCDFV